MVVVKSLGNSLVIFLKNDPGNQDVVTKDKTFFCDYFDLNTDYGAILNAMCANSEILDASVKFSPGIRVLRQDPWETLCSFIISQNNNIPRIKSIIERLCINFGKKITDEKYTFPSAEVLGCLTERELFPIKCGFRAKYIVGAAKKVKSKEVRLDEINSLPTNVAKSELMKICGVGPKVADCTLLYAYHRFDVVPKDVWMKRLIDRFFCKTPNLENVFGKYAGLAQIYLFNYIRKTPTISEKYKISS